MAKGFERNKLRIGILDSFGKDLARRSHCHCELCGTGNVKLRVYEVPPAPENPDIDTCLFICETCRRQIENPKTIEPNYWRSLHETVWSELPPVRIMAFRLLTKLAVSEDWAAEILEQLYLDEEIKEWAEKAKL